MSLGDHRSAAPCSGCQPFSFGGGEMPPDIAVGVMSGTSGSRSASRARSMSVGADSVDGHHPASLSLNGGSAQAESSLFACASHQAPTSPFQDHVSSREQTPRPPDRDQRDDGRKSSGGSTSSSGGGRRPCGPKVKKDEMQKAVLLSYYNKCPKPTSQQIHLIGRETNLTTKEVRNWFRNRRCRGPKPPDCEMQNPELVAGTVGGLPPLTPDDIQAEFGDAMDISCANGTAWQGCSMGHIHQSMVNQYPSMHMHQPSFASISPSDVLTAAGDRVPPSPSPGVFGSFSTSLQTIPPIAVDNQPQQQDKAALTFRSRTQQQCYTIMKNRFLVQLQRWEKGSIERQEMLDELVKILTREEKEHVVEEIDSHMSQVHYRLMPHEVTRKRSERAWRDLQRIFRVRKHGQASDDSGQGHSSDGSSSHGSFGHSHHGGMFKNSSGSSADSSGDLASGNSGKCNKAMVKGLASIFKSRRQYLEEVCRELGYQITPWMIMERGDDHSIPSGNSAMRPTGQRPASLSSLQHQASTPMMPWMQGGSSTSQVVPLSAPPTMAQASFGGASATGNDDVFPSVAAMLFNNWG